LRVVVQGLRAWVLEFRERERTWPERTPYLGFLIGVRVYGLGFRERERV